MANRLTAIQKRAERICKDAIEHGATRTQWDNSEPAGSAVLVALEHASARAYVTLYPRTHTYLVSWCTYGDDVRFNPGRMRDVNPYHGCKATNVVNSFNDLRFVISQGFDRIADGSAFIRMGE
jgi:hypothetical protein